MFNSGLCCDDIYLPSFFFRNVHGFPQDRQIGDSISLDEEGDGVMWETTVHGVYYQVCLDPQGAGATAGWTLQASQLINHSATQSHPCHTLVTLLCSQCAS